MSQTEKILDLDYDSPLENLFGFTGSPWCMGLSSLGIWFFLVSPGKNGRSPIWADFPVVPFFLGMLCVWALGYWLKANYDVRYQLDPETQQLDQVRKIFGQTFKSRVAEFSELHAAGVMSTWSDDKQGNRNWEYALCLITRSARIIRVSSFSSSAMGHQAASIAKKLGIVNFPCQEKAGTLKARRSRDGQVTLGYKAPLKAISSLTAFLVIAVVVAGIIGGCILLMP